MAVTLQEAVTLIEERKARGPVTRPKRATTRKKKAATAGTVRKTTRKRAVAGAV